MKRSILIILVVLMALVFSNSQSASATIITVEVTGVVDGVATHGGLALDGSVIVGSEMTGFCTYDTETPDLHAGEYDGKYELISISMTVGNYTFTHNPMSPESPLFEVSVFYGHSYDAWSYDPSFDGIVYIDGSPKIYDEVNFDPFGLRLMYLVHPHNDITDELPTSFPDISTFTTREFGVGVDSPPEEPGFAIWGEVTSLNVVPEPASILLLGLGGLALLRNRRA